MSTRKRTKSGERADCDNGEMHVDVRSLVLKECQGARMHLKGENECKEVLRNCRDDTTIGTTNVGV
jgi:hypothetical protein